MIVVLISALCCGFCACAAQVAHNRFWKSYEKKTACLLDAPQPDRQANPILAAAIYSAGSGLLMCAAYALFGTTAVLILAVLICGKKLYECGIWLYVAYRSSRRLW